MRVKLNAKEYGIPQFVYGKRYYLAYAGVTYGEEFLLTRKNRLEMCEYLEIDGETIKTSSHWMSKKRLKQLLRSGVVRWMGEV